MPLTLTKRGKFYHATGSIAGQRIRKSTGCRTRAEADAWANRLEKDIIERHAFGPQAVLTFAEAALDYIETGGEGRFLAALLEYLGPHYRLADVTNATLLEAGRALYPGRSPATINRQVITPASAVVNMAAENHGLPLRKFRRLKARGARTRWLSPQEMEALMDHAAPHLVPILAMLIGTGCRAGEVIGAQAKDWHPETGEVWLPETKNGWPRMVQMPGRARDLVAPAAAPHGALFRTPKGAAYVQRQGGGGQIQTAFNHARDAAGLGADVTPHVLRHTWATWFYAATRDFGRMLDLGGWRTTSTAERYRKMAPADLGDRLKDHGWDFTRLGRDLPPLARPGLRVIK